MYQTSMDEIKTDIQKRNLIALQAGEITNKKSTLSTSGCVNIALCDR
jgi:hypothetical protein